MSESEIVIGGGRKGFYKRNYKPRPSGDGNESASRPSAVTQRNVDRISYPSLARNKIELCRSTVESRTPKIRNYPDEISFRSHRTPRRAESRRVASQPPQKRATTTTPAATATTTTMRGSRYFLFARVWRERAHINYNEQG